MKKLFVQMLTWIYAVTNVKILLPLLEIMIPILTTINVRIKNDGLLNVIVFVMNSPCYCSICLFVIFTTTNFNLNSNAIRNEKKWSSFILFGSVLQC